MLTDDAGVRFILDLGRHPSHEQLLISRKFEELQGPSLCVENNRTFSEKDLENISTFASRGKIHERNTMIGRFGVGFSTAFGISDCPMIITDNFLYVFDPNKAFITACRNAYPFTRTSFCH